jgi:peptide/nickel transport system substrate-binding protein
MFTCTEEKFDMYKKRLMLTVGLLAAFSMILSACGPSTTATPAPVNTEAPAAPTAAPPTTRHGGWLDEIDFSVVASDSAISQVQAGAVDVYSYGLASSDFPSIKSSGLKYDSYYGASYAIEMNPAKLKDETKLNPFTDAKIREALNWMVDRNYINQEVYGGGSLPKLAVIATDLVEYSDLVDVIRGLEAKYAYNLDQAKQIVSTEMTAMGATAGSDGKWQYKGSPVTLIFIIRPDGDGTRKPVGDYVANQLETVGFTVDRQYKKSSEAFPIVLDSDPTEGQWELYTAQWGAPGLTRDERSQFQQMYAPDSQQGDQPFLSHTDIDPAYQKLADDLANGQYTTAQQRHDMMAQALPLSLQDSLQVWLIDGLSYSLYKPNVLVTNDIGAGIEASPMNPFNIRFTDKEGGQLKIGSNDLFSDPWNPIAGGNGTWDASVMRYTTTGSDYAAQGGVVGDPFTGLAWPQRIATAEVTVETGLPVVTNSNWVTLKTADTISVPPDAWIDWDAKAQKFITAAEKFPDGTTAKVKSVVTYPPDLFTTIKWHDGSPLSVADFIMPSIEWFDRANKDSPIYDEQAVPYFSALIPTFKGFRITSTNPLTIESYSDSYYGDAELDVITDWPSSPYGLQGENSWDVLAVSNLAEAAGELAYSADKADTNKIEETSWVGGPSLDILSKELDKASSESLIPYEPTLGQYITADEAKARYDNLKKWYTDHGNFWVGTGPYYLDKAFTTEKSAVLKNNPDFPDLANRWESFSAPKLATAVLDGPAQVKAGDTATFDVNVTYNGNPYAQSDVKQAKYLVYDSTNAVISSGAATAVADGQWQVVLGPDVTSKLAAGSYKIEVAIVPIPVAVAAFTSLDFVAVP